MIDPELRGPFWGRDLPDMRADIATRGATAVIGETLDAIERINPTLNAFVHIDRADALEQAARRDADDGPRGPLHGIPVAIKDIIDVSGWPITCGSAVREGYLARSDAAVVRRLRAVGAIIVGLTLTHEFAFGVTSDVAVQGPAHNPHDLGRVTGGSSGGSAAAVAAGLVPLAIGTDTGGSVRVPAAFCGVVGLKGAYAAVPTDGVFALSPTLDHIGTIASSVELARIGFDVISGAGDHSRSTSSARPAGRSRVAQSRLRWDDISMVPHQNTEVARVVRRVVTDIWGPLSEPVTLDDWTAMRADAATVMTREAFEVHRAWIDDRRDRYQLEVWERIDGGRSISDASYAAALANRERQRSNAQRAIPPGTVLVSPTVSIVAPPIGERTTQVGGGPGVTSRIITNLTTRWNLLGYPAVSVPIGMVDGLPVGLQLVSAPGSEAALLTAAAQVEQHVLGAAHRDR